MFQISKKSSSNYDLTTGAPRTLEFVASNMNLAIRTGTLPRYTLFGIGTEFSVHLELTNFLHDTVLI